MRFGWGSRDLRRTSEPLAALADGLTQKQACIASGICENTLAAWRERYPDLEPRIEAAREAARQKALEGIKTAGDDGDWRASEAFLRMSFHTDYRQNQSINVNATATAQQATIITDEQRKRLIEMRHQLIRRELRAGTVKAIEAKLSDGVAKAEVVPEIAEAGLLLRGVPG